MKKIIEKISKTELDSLEKLLDRLFKSVNIDIEFTKHFLDRLNDSRNGEDITTPELAELFGATYKKYGKKLSKLSPDTQAVLKDIRSDINIPFVIQLNDSGMLELISKTVMRKKNFSTPNDVLKVGEMKLATRILSLINEKLVILNKGKKSGQVVYLAGGAGSGKGFSAQKFLELRDYKKFDVDELKRMIIKIAKIKGDKELAGLDLGNKDDVFKLHQYVKDKGLEDKILNNFFNSIKEKSDLPNILFDITFKDTKNYYEKQEKLNQLGYKPESTHLVWILSDYEVSIEQNQQRERKVPEDIVFQTHKGAATTMKNILSGNMPEGMDGEIYVIFSDKRLSVAQKSSTRPQYFNITDFLYVKVKEAGKPIKSEAEIKKEVFSLAKQMVPKEVSGLFS